MQLRLVHCLAWLLPALAAASCATNPAPGERVRARPVPVQPTVEHWGSMRTVLREGHTEGRVTLAEVVGPRTVGVGALAGLGAEITIDGGAVRLAEVLDATSPEGMRSRAATPDDQATLLVLADVAEWSATPLPAVPGLDTLEQLIRTRAQLAGFDLARPFPFRVEGRASALRLHVLDHSCPIANPTGPPPWRFDGPVEQAVLVGFYAQDSAGLLTHHTQTTHTHALAPAGDLSGHLDDVVLTAGARLFLPATGTNAE